MEQREIKFRAWDRTQNFMAEFDLFDHDCDYIGNWVDCPDIIMAKNCDIMQFIGMQDSKGVDIYESDIITWSDSEDTPRVVVWDAEAAAYVAKFTNHLDGGGYYMAGSIPKSTTIIGNIYENPDLLSNPLPSNG